MDVVIVAACGVIATGVGTRLDAGVRPRLRSRKARTADDDDDDLGDVMAAYQVF